ncbi:nucleotide sugar dehydrogenase [Motilimonas cestriensis]|uniref:Nucleotide sugar dehydrogenase n=1 Tax=Motilimonas cestriensis TaxID=2742685 RepID=A0ABS8W6L8_9GAMM|nr:nucleotide sugar dehydrogenase [Motilimonas cestriensis]MCE2594002.1 nucleotide sugar dehydrogenase [Motilimonas cestriensis]
MSSLQMPQKVAVLGLGYVGLPLTLEFAKHFETVGFDINAQRVTELRQGRDRTLEATTEQLQASQAVFSSDSQDLADCQFFIVSVPTPIDKHHQPDLSPLVGASETVAKVLKRGDIVVYESTVFPGATEEVCVPLLEAGSGLVFNQDFYCGYSPERINPGDKEHTLTSIVKVTSGSTPDVAEIVDAMYGKVIMAGTYKASSIKVAEAAKVIENTQRDVNIALINELALIFDKIGINTEEVLDAAATKWNFLHFHPGLVGGHCIGVDPYYLTYKAQELGYHPEMILAGRRLNDDMGIYIADRVVRLMLKQKIQVSQSNVLIMGLTFKENCPDLRNTKVIDVINELKTMDVNVAVFDPWADPEEAQRLYGIELHTELPEQQYDALVLTVSHRQIMALSEADYKGLSNPNGCVIFDVKRILDSPLVTGRL